MDLLMMVSPTLRSTCTRSSFPSNTPLHPLLGATPISTFTGLHQYARVYLVGLPGHCGLQHTHRCAGCWIEQFCRRGRAKDDGLKWESREGIARSPVPIPEICCPQHNALLPSLKTSAPPSTLQPPPPKPAQICSAVCSPSGILSGRPRLPPLLPPPPTCPAQQHQQYRSHGYPSQATDEYRRAMHTPLSLSIGLSLHRRRRPPVRVRGVLIGDWAWAERELFTVGMRGLGSIRGSVW